MVKLNVFRELRWVDWRYWAPLYVMELDLSTKISHSTQFSQ